MAQDVHGHPHRCGDDQPITVIIVTGVDMVVAINIDKAGGCCDHLLVVGSVW